MRNLVAILIATFFGVAIASSVEAGAPVAVQTATAFDLDSIPLKPPVCDKLGHCGRRHHYYRGGPRYYGGFGYGGGYYPSYGVYRPIYGGYGPAYYPSYRRGCYGGYGFGGYGYGGSVNIRW